MYYPCRVMHPLWHCCGEGDNSTKGPEVGSPNDGRTGQAVLACVNIIEISASL
jgi:hypothetical protein